MKNISTPFLIPILALSLVAGLSGAPNALAQSASVQSSSSVNSSFNWSSWRDWIGNRPVIRTIDTTSGPIGTEVELVGRNFDDDSRVRFGNGVIEDPTVSDDGTRLSFTVPQTLDRYCSPLRRTCEPRPIEVTERKYSVRVQDGLRTSNAVRFEVTGDATAPLSISTIEGPSALAPDAEGTWTVNVDAESDENLEYSVIWGDEGASPMRLFGGGTTQSSATFTHTYANEGTYEPEFTVTDADGNTVTKTAAAVVVSDEANDVPHISTITPTAAMTGTVTITGTGFDTDSEVFIGSTTEADNVTVVNDTEITFTVPTSITVGDHSVTVKDNDGTSNSVSLTVTNPKGTVSVSGVNAPTQLTVGEDGTWTVHASSKFSGNLTYSVDWGQSSLLKRMLGADVTTQSSATFTHAYDAEGTYTPKFTITDEAGNSASVKVSVKVEDAE